MDKHAVISRIKEQKIVAIIREVEEEQLIEVVKALIKGGVTLLEITFDHAESQYVESTSNKIRRVVDYFGDQVCVGAGTVLTQAEVEAAVGAGAEFIISPNVNEQVIAATLKCSKVSIPGALTPTEAVNAHTAGADFVKLFPAGELGHGYIKAFFGPLKHIPFIGVGGVVPDNVKEFMEMGLQGVGVGSSLVNSKELDTEKITLNAKKFKGNLL